MVYVDQDIAERNEEPFVTLGKTKRFDNKVSFGEHMSCTLSQREKVYVKDGDLVSVSSYTRFSSGN
jgi:molybdenum cofactor sulfurtransferase